MADFPDMSPSAAEAFDDFVTLGPARSLPKLAAKYRDTTEPVPTRQLSRLKIWSTRYRWQDRIATAVSDLTAERLKRADELDADTFYLMSVALNDRAKYTTREALDAIVKIRESVRKPVTRIEHSGPGGTALTIVLGERPDGPQ